MSKPTVHDIARAAGVSLATVDRVLNTRPGVRSATVERVQAAIASLGYRRDVTAANLARQRQYRFLFVLPGGDSEFLTDLSNQVGVAADQSTDRTRVEVMRVPPRDHRILRAALAGIDPKATDGLAIMAEETPVMRDEIGRLSRAGVAVVSLVTDQAAEGHCHFVGIDNHAAGRTAAVLMGRFIGARSGALAVVVNSTMARDMVDRRLGFDRVIAERFPHLHTLPSLEGHDDRAQTAAVLGTCLAAHDDIVGVYSAGAGTRGITEVLTGLDPDRPCISIAHELTPHARAALRDGTLDAVITQDTGHIARSAIRVLRAKCDRTPILEAQERIRIEIVLRENLP